MNKTAFAGILFLPTQIYAFELNLEDYLGKAQGLLSPAFEFVWPFLPALLLIFLFLLPVLLFRSGPRLRLFLFLPFLVIFLGLLGFYRWDLFLRSLQEFWPFSCVMVLACLSGLGMRLETRLSALPAVNTLYLAVAMFFSALFGALVATMFLAPALFRSNQHREKAVHVGVFFILLVSSTGGLLQPMGSPLAILSYLQGVSPVWFWKVVPVWLLASVCLLVMFYLYDKWTLKGDTSAFDPGMDLRFELDRAIQNKQVPQSLIMRTLEYLESSEGFQLRIGYRPLLFLVGLSGLYAADFMGNPFFLREVVTAVCAFLILLGLLREGGLNGERLLPLADMAMFYTFAFFGIVGLLPVLEPDLNWFASPTTPLEHYVTAGVASAFLDNAANMLLFVHTDMLAVSVDRSLLLAPNTGSLAALASMPGAERNLMAFLWGSSLLGGLTYGGHVLNLYVRRSATAHGIYMPGSFRYLLHSLPFSLIVFGIVGWLFFW